MGTGSVAPRVIQKQRLESLEWHHRAVSCPTCQTTVVARQRHYFPELQGLIPILAPFWIPAVMIARLLPKPWRCAVCGTKQSRAHFLAKEGAELAEAMHNTDRLLHAQRQRDPAVRRRPPRYRRPLVSDSLAERGWFGDDSTSAAAGFDGLADAVSRAAYRGMKPWLAQAIMIVGTVATFAVWFLGGGIAALLVALILMAFLTAYRPRRRRSE